MAVDTRHLHHFPQRSGGYVSVASSLRKIRVYVIEFVVLASSPLEVASSGEWYSSPSRHTLRVAKWRVLPITGRKSTIAKQAVDDSNHTIRTHENRNKSR